jgi:hypothetical protein
MFPVSIRAIVFYRSCSPNLVIPEGKLKTLRFVDREIPFGNDKVAETRPINQNSTTPACQYEVGDHSHYFLLVNPLYLLE